jgi:putative two-component system response regulator
MNNEVISEDNSEDKKQATVLTIEDEKAVRDSFRNYLEDYDYNVMEAEDGRSGVKKFLEGKPDLVMVDLRMPEMDGLEVLEKITAASPDTPIIVVSGTGVMHDAVEALHLGAWDYLLKPVEDLTVLLHAVEKALERARLIGENRRYRNHLEDMIRLRTAQLERANKELEETRLQVIRRLGKAAEYKDNESGKHVIRVGLYCGILAEGLGLDEKSAEMISQCSLMHDIGKIGIPDNILQKPGPLDIDEFLLQQQHPGMGSDILKPLPGEETAVYRKHARIGEDILDNGDLGFLETARKIAAHHHERWDGTGYLDGLKGEEIPIEARITAVADIYDSLSGKRPYRDPFPEEKCLEIINQLSGTFLDPAIVAVFFKSLDRILAVKEKWKD